MVGFLESKDPQENDADGSAEVRRSSVRWITEVTAAKPIRSQRGSATD